MGINENKFGENLLWFLDDYAMWNADDVDGPEIEVYGEDENGMEGSCTVNTIELAGEAAKEIRALIAERDELRAYKEAAEKQEPVQWVCELSSNPWPNGGGTRRDTKEEALKFINSESNHCKYDTVSPIYRLPVPADKPAVTNDDMALLASGMDQPWCMRECVRKLIEAAEILLDRKSYDGHGHEEIAEAKRVANLYLAAPSHSQQSAETKDLKIAFATYCALTFDKVLDVVSNHNKIYERLLSITPTEITNQIVREINTNRCPSHESEQGDGA